jgi:hypothetical protein
MGRAGGDGEGAARGHCIARVDAEIEHRQLQLGLVRKHGNVGALDVQAELDVRADSMPQHILDMLNKGSH